MRPAFFFFSRVVTAGVLGLFATNAAPAQDRKLAAAVSAIEDSVHRKGADVAVALRTLDGKTEWMWRADEPFHAASTMKVPVLVELFRQRRDGKLKLEEPLVLKNEFRSIADGSSYSLGADDDSEQNLYQHLGETRTLAQLADLMITVSSNLSTNLLIERLGIEGIRGSVHALGADGMNVVRGVEDNKAFELGIYNTTTARGLLIVLTAIAKGEAVDAASSQEMITILERQQFNEGIPAGLPAGVRVAHKTGEITKIHHDAAIVLAPRPFVLVILTRGLSETKDSAALMAQIAHRLYQATQQ